MDKITFSILLGFTITVFSCSKVEHPDEDYCNNAKIIAITCAGTVIQLLKSSHTGEQWVDFTNDKKVTYANCVIVDVIPVDEQVTGTVISIQFEIVEKFPRGNYCDLGGLPKTKISINKVYKNCY